MKVQMTTKAIKRKRINLETIDRPKWVTVMGFTLTGFLALMSIMPIFLILGISFSSEESIRLYGYQFIPSEVSFSGYEYIFRNIGPILKAYGVTFAVAALGTVYGLTIMFGYAYMLSRPDFPWKKQFNFYVLVPMLFSGGLIPTYIIMTNVYHLGDTFWVLFVGGGVSSMYIYIMRTYLATSVPNEVIEAATIDGAGTICCLVKIVLPMAIPSIATIGLFLVVYFWNDWYTAFLYILRNNDIVPISLLIQRIEKDINFLANNREVLGSEAARVYESVIPTDSFRMGLVLVAILPMLIAYPFFQKYFVKGMTIGAVKG